MEHRVSVSKCLRLEENLEGLGLGQKAGSLSLVLGIKVWFYKAEFSVYHAAKNSSQI